MIPTTDFRSGINAVARPTMNMQPSEKQWIKKYKGTTRMMVQETPLSSWKRSAPIIATMAGIAWSIICLMAVEMGMAAVGKLKLLINPFEPRMMEVPADKPPVANLR